MKLKPCPFCGGEAKVMKGETIMEEGVEYPPWVYCENCGASGSSVEEWNQQTSGSDEDDEEDILDGDLEDQFEKLMGGDI